MYSDKKNILQLIALMRAHNVTNVVLCPGSRNAPIVQSLAECSAFKCFTVVDERSAAFFALGLAQQTGFPAAVCCTSGTALLNTHSAVAEAYYQKVPLLVISADRPVSWIGQMDGQTLPQPGVFGSLVKKSVTLPEPANEEDEWYCNRLINEALLELAHYDYAPVHINVPVSEPLFQYTTKTLPEVRVINRVEQYILLDRLHRNTWNYERIVLVMGQSPLGYLSESEMQILIEKGVVVLAEHLSNEQCEGVITNFDEVLYAQADDEKLAPDLVITCGGHIVSKRLKQFLRKVRPLNHWHVSKSGDVADLFQCLTMVIEAYTDEFLVSSKDRMPIPDGNPEFLQYWQESSFKVKQKAATFTDFHFSDLTVMRSFLEKMPEWSALHLANSSTVRNAQLFSLPECTKVFCNRGTSGIDGSLSTAVGFAAADILDKEQKGDRLNFLVIGDLSFFYDMNGLWNKHLSPRLRILLVNNGGGEIFRLLPGLKNNQSTSTYVAATHATTAEGWASSLDITYLKASNTKELEVALEEFTKKTTSPVLLEVNTDSEVNAEVFKAYYHNLKKK